MSALVSIIIPIYNLEKYIENCLKSIVAQTYKNLEILCIDDGSTDGSAEIIKSMAESDPRIKYIYQENAGVSAARNKGLDTATGEYVMFVDGDDYINLHMVENFLIEAEKSSAEIIYSNLKRTYNFSENINEDYLFKSIFNVNIEDVYEKYFCGYTVIGNFISSALIDTIRFYEDISIGEDTCFMLSIGVKAKKKLLIGQQYYYYYYRQNSAMNDAFKYNKSSVIIARGYLYDIIKNTKHKKLKQCFLEGIYKAIFEYRVLCKDSDCQEMVKKRCWNIGNKYFNDLFRSKDIPFYRKVALIMCYIFPPFYRISRIILDPTMLDYYNKRKNIEND